VAIETIDLIGNRGSSEGALADAFRRPITYLRISVTDRCNLRCTYCMPEAGLPWIPKPEILSFEEIEQIVRAAASVGVRSIRLTGGEPLVRRGLARLVGRLSAIDGIEDVALSTNGLLLAEQAGPLAEAGLRRVNVSLDTLKPERFESIARRPGLERVLAGIDAAIAAGLAPLKINCVVMRGSNDDELAAFAALTRERPVFVRFIEMMPVLDNVDAQRDAYVSSDEILERIRAVEALEPSPGPGGNGPARYFAFACAITATPAIACGSRPTDACDSASSAISKSICARRCDRARRAPSSRRSSKAACSSSRSVTTSGLGSRRAGCGRSRKSAASAKIFGSTRSHGDAGGRSKGSA
jgi:cyclic pyranopterin phosphate synthase